MGAEGFKARAVSSVLVSMLLPRLRPYRNSFPSTSPDPLILQTLPLSYLQEAAQHQACSASTFSGGLRFCSNILLFDHLLVCMSIHPFSRSFILSLIP